MLYKCIVQANCYILKGKQNTLEEKFKCNVLLVEHQMTISECMLYTIQKCMGSIASVYFRDKKDRAADAGMGESLCSSPRAKYLFDWFLLTWLCHLMRIPPMKQQRE